MLEVKRRECRTKSTEVELWVNGLSLKKRMKSSKKLSEKVTIGYTWGWKRKKFLFIDSLFSELTKLWDFEVVNFIRNLKILAKLKRGLKSSEKLWWNVIFKFTWVWQRKESLFNDGLFSKRLELSVFEVMFFAQKLKFWLAEEMKKNPRKIVWKYDIWVDLGVTRKKFFFIDGLYSERTKLSHWSFFFLVKQLKVWLSWREE